MKRIAYFLLPLTIIAQPDMAKALTLTFDSVLPAYESSDEISIVEQGVTITAAHWSAGVVYNTMPGGVLLVDSGTAFTSWLTFSMPVPFAAKSFDVFAYGSLAVILPGGEDDPVPAIYDNVVVQGYRQGSLVASQAFTTGWEGGNFTFALDSTFGALDLLRIESVRPEGGFYEGFPIACNDAPCTAFQLDNVMLAPVPLPAGVLFLAGGVVALRLIRRR